MGDPGIDDQQSRIGRHCNGLELEGAAIQHHRVILRASGDHVLIHDAAANTDEISLDALAQLRELASLDLDIGTIEQRECEHGFEGRRRAEPAAQRNITIDDDVGTAQGIAGTFQDRRDAFDVLVPLRVFALLDPIEIDLFQAVEDAREDAQGAVGSRRDRDPGVEPGRCREYESLVVIGVPANDIDAPRRAEQLRLVAEATDERVVYRSGSDCHRRRCDRLIVHGGFMIRPLCSATRSGYCRVREARSSPRQWLL